MDPQAEFKQALTKGDIATVGQLLEHNPCLLHHSWEGVGTALVIALKHGHTNIAELLLRSGADIDQTFGRQRGTALRLLIFQGFLEESEYLLQKGADPNHRDIGGTTPLMYLVGLGHPDTMPLKDAVLLLLENGADPSAERWGQTAVDYASGAKHGEIAQILKEWQEEMQTAEPANGSPPPKK